MFTFEITLPGSKCKLSSSMVPGISTSSRAMLQQIMIRNRTLDTTSDLFIALSVVFFFFSSRRRHTRLQGDWSSDVCSSDLTNDGCTPARKNDSLLKSWSPENHEAQPSITSLRRASSSLKPRGRGTSEEVPQIGRASCRERV